jgi:rhodanese-related sulfurtransferase
MAREAAARIARRFGVTSIDEHELTAMQRDTDRTTYLLDVRSPEEFRAGHRPGSRSAPGGQLIQALDTYVAVRNARLVLIDGDGARANMTASWLIQMGVKDVSVLTDGLNAPDLVVGDDPRVVAGLGEATCTFIRATELNHALDKKQVTVIDLASSIEHREGHIPGALFAVRSRLASAVADIPLADSVVLTSPDGVLARLAAPELARLTTKAVSVLEGGTTAWVKAGFTLAKGAASIAGEPDDVWYRPYDRDDNIERAMQAYLDWEIGLSAQIARDGDARFAATP